MWIVDDVRQESFIMTKRTCTKRKIEEIIFGRFNILKCSSNFIVVGIPVSRHQKDGSKQHN